MTKIKIEDALFERAQRTAKTAGYSSVDEFVAHCVEKELLNFKDDIVESQVADQLRGLGYIE